MSTPYQTWNGDKRKERPRGGRSLVSTDRDDKIRTCDPLLPKQSGTLHFATLPSALPGCVVFLDVTTAETKTGVLLIEQFKKTK
jgi:hypothetical protein